LFPGYIEAHAVVGYELRDARAVAPPLPHDRLYWPEETPAELRQSMIKVHNYASWELASVGDVFRPLRPARPLGC